MMKTITTSRPQDTWNVNSYQFGWEICKNVKLAKNAFFLTGPRSWKSSTGHFKCEYLPIWVRNMQKCEISKNHTFSTEPRSWKTFFFRLSGKPPKMRKTITKGHLKCKYLPIWMRNMQKFEFSKNAIFRQIRSHENLQFFRLSGKPSKMMKTTTSWPQDTLNVNICPFGWRICKNVKLAKFTFSIGPRSWKSSIFSAFWKIFQNDENYHQLTTGHLKCNICPFG